MFVGVIEQENECRKLCPFLPRPEFDGYCSRCVSPELRLSMMRSSWMSNFEMAVVDEDLQSAIEYLEAPFFAMEEMPISRRTNNALKKAMRVGAKSMVQLLYERHAIDFDEEPMLHLLAAFNTVHAPRRKQKELFDYLISLDEVKVRIEKAPTLQTLMGYPAAHVDREKRDLIVDWLCGGSEPASPVLSKLARLTREEFQTSMWADDQPPEEEDDDYEMKRDQFPKRPRRSPDRTGKRKGTQLEDEGEEFVRMFFPPGTDDGEM